MLLGDLRQVRDYLHKPEVRRESRQRLAKAVEEDTRVLVGHSLGSVVAYEALCANLDRPVRALITLGSPLGLTHLIFGRLEPTPRSAKDAGLSLRGHWPGRGRAGTNIADEADVVALVKDLRLGFGPDVDGWIVDNGARAHNVKPYLTAVETGRAIRAGLGSR